MKLLSSDFVIDKNLKRKFKNVWNQIGSLYVIVSTPGDMPLKIESQGNGGVEMNFVPCRIFRSGEQVYGANNEYNM